VLILKGLLAANRAQDAFSQFWELSLAAAPQSKNANLEIGVPGHEPNIT